MFELIDNVSSSGGGREGGKSGVCRLLISSLMIESIALLFGRSSSQDEFRTFKMSLSRIGSGGGTVSSLSLPGSDNRPAVLIISSS